MTFKRVADRDLKAALYTTDPAGGEALRGGVVHVWRFLCDGLPEAQRERGLALVPPDELRRARRFVRREHQEAFLTQRVFLRSLLSRYVPVSPLKLEFSLGERGKPSLPGDRPHFNLSHAADRALLAVATDFALGVDIERLDAKIDPRELGPTVLAPSETPLVEGLGGAIQKRAFLRIWCRKEACLKAAGVGLLDDLISLSVATDRVDLRRCGDRRIDPERAPIVFVQDLDMGDAHVAALATTAPCAPVAAAPLLERPLLL